MTGAPLSRPPHLAEGLRGGPARAGGAAGSADWASAPGGGRQLRGGLAWPGCAACERGCTGPRRSRPPAARGGCGLALALAWALSFRPLGESCPFLLCCCCCCSESVREVEVCRVFRRAAWTASWLWWNQSALLRLAAGARRAGQGLLPH